MWVRSIYVNADKARYGRNKTTKKYSIATVNAPFVTLCISKRGVRELADRERASRVDNRRYTP
jgi:hypothetical protein